MAVIRASTGLERRVTFHPATEGRSACIRFVVAGAEGVVDFIALTFWSIDSMRQVVAPALPPLGQNVGIHWKTPVPGHELLDCDFFGKCYARSSGWSASGLMSTLVAEGEALVWAELERLYHATAEKAREA